MARDKERADQLMVRLGLAESREKAKRLIMAGLVTMETKGSVENVEKPGQSLPLSTQLHVKETRRFVSRGGEKLLTALEVFDIPVQGKIVLDAGASTGGFTDCLLQHGAVKVYAVDVGKGQLDYRLREDPRVEVMEGVNLRHAGKNLLPEEVDLVVVDCSFISLAHILPPCVDLLKPGGTVVALVKPQFELGPEKVRKGVVTSPSLQQQAVKKIQDFAVNELKLEYLGVVPSRIKGPKGNQEYLMYLKKT